MTAKQYDCKNCMAAKRHKCKVSSDRDCAAGRLGSFTAIHTVHPDSKDTLSPIYDTAGLRSNDVCRFCGPRSRIEVHPR